MGTLISPLVFTKVDQGGNHWTEVYSIFEYTSAGILPTGESIDLSSLMRRVEYITAQLISGQNDFMPVPNATDFPGNAGSGRMRLYAGASGIVTLNISGAGIQITSGQTFQVSGVLPLISGLLVLGASGAFNAGREFTTLLSGTAVSGARAYIHAIGY